MKKLLYHSILLALSVCNTLFWACSAKKASNTYGDNKMYQNEDSTEEVKMKERKTKMPFDTTAVPISPSRQTTPLPNR